MDNDKPVEAMPNRLSIHNLNKDLHSDVTITVQVFDQTNHININYGILQGDTISPKLFANAVQDILKTLEWDHLGITINDEQLTNLRKADDIVLFANNTDDLQRLITDLHEAASSTRLKMKISKTKIVSNTENSISDRK